jgi:HK97 family phage major capsid protein
MATIAEQIAAFETKRAALVAANEAIMEKAAAEGSTLDAEQEDTFDNNQADIEAIDKHLARLRVTEKTLKTKAVEPKGDNPDDAGASRGGHRIEVKTQPKLKPGVEFARIAKVRAAAKLDNERALDVAERMYGENSNVFGFYKAAVQPGTTASGNWAAALVSDESGPVADFAEYLRPMSILGKFGTGNIPSLRNVPFRQRLISQTGGGAAYWTGEAKPKGLTSFNFTSTTLEPLKVATIAVLSEENIRDSSPASDLIVRDQLAAAVTARIDQDFIDPANNGSANVKPASITYGAQAIAAETFSDADDVRTDVRSVMQYFINANNPPSSGVWIMSSGNALALSLLMNGLGQAEFPGISLSGGTFAGLPVITSEYIGSNVLLVNASDIYLGDEGGVTVDMSTEASLEMLTDTFTQNPPTGASLVSLWQNNLVGLRAERTLNWARRRESAVTYLTNVAWGGPVNSS